MDGSKKSERALEAAIKLKNENDKIYIYHVKDTDNTKDKINQ